jgi:hypothetical protein
MGMMDAAILPVSCCDTNVSVRVSSNPFPANALSGRRLMTPKSSRDLPGPEPRKNTERDDEKARVKDADKNDGEDRDRVHGDGSEIGLDK